MYDYLQSMRILLLGFSLFLLTVSEVCQPLYWQVDPDYEAPLDQTGVVASQQIVFGDVVTSTGIVPLKKLYTIFDIKANGTYDSTNVKAKIVNNQIQVTGGVINLKFYLFLMTKSTVGKDYDGNATATLRNIQVNYTKKPALIKGSAVWSLTNLSPSIPNNLVPNNDYNPPILHNQDKLVFNNLITTDLYAQVSAYYNMNLSSLFARAMQSQPISKTFNTSGLYNYTYPRSDNYISVNVSVQNFSISAQDGVALGYYGKVAGSPDRCSQFVPDLTQKASYITPQMILNLWDGFAKTGIWQPVTLDSTTLKSKYFKFKVIDLQSIIPTVRQKIPNQLEPLNAKCSLVSSTLPTNFDTQYQLINTTLDWKCGLYLVNGPQTNLMNLNLSVLYRIKIGQQNSQLRVKIISAQKKSSNWEQVSGFPIESAELADTYLTDLVSSMQGLSVMGDGFLQPPREAPKVTIQQTFIKLTDTKQYQTI